MVEAGKGGFQPTDRSAQSRRADFDLLRRISSLENGNGHGGNANIVAVPYDQWPPTDMQPDTLYLRLAP